MQYIGFGYLRVSGKGQIDGDGPDRQTEAIERFCRQNDVEVIKHYFDPAVSGTVEPLDRPKFVEMLIDLEQNERIEAAIRSGLVQGRCIVVERMDRLGRTLRVTETLLMECRNRGVKVFAADQGTLVDLASDDIDPTRTLLRQILGAVAEWEKSAMVKKLRVARDRMREANGRCEGPKPYGEHPDRPWEREVQAFIQQERNDGWTFAEIATHLNNVNQKTRHGRKWTASLVFQAVGLRRKARLLPKVPENTGDDKTPSAGNYLPA